MEEYDGTLVQRYYDNRPVQAAARLVRIGLPTLNWYLQTKWDNMTWSTGLYSDEQIGYFKEQRADQLRKAIVDSGSTTFIKSGQALSLRPDIVKDEAVIRELEKLQDEVGTFDNDVAMEIMRDELGVDPREIYDFVYDLPVASASIGQVYRCKLKKAPYTEVAVKVQRPDALGSAALDMYILRRLADNYKNRKKLRSDLVSIADEFGKQLFGELNYIKEAYNCIRFKELYGDIPDIFVPEVYLNFTTERVLTQQWVEGEKGPWAEKGEKMLTIGIQCSVLQILQSGFFHADPHRGNLLKTSDDRLAYLDFGMMSNVSALNRYSLIGMTLGLQYRDIGMVAENLVNIGFLPNNTDLGVLVPAVENAFRNATGGEGASKLNFTKLNENINNISYLLPFRIPPFYSLIVRTLTILEGLALSVDPDFKLVRGAYPFIARQVLRSDSDALRQLLERILITPEGGIQWRRLEQLTTISRAAQNTEYKKLKEAEVKDENSKRKADERREDDEEAVDEEEEEDITLELVQEMLRYLLSESGDYLREPLVNEIVETLDSVLLAATNLASFASAGLFPRADAAPDRKRLERIWRVVSSVSQESLDDLTEAANSAAPTSRGNNVVLRDIVSFGNEFQALLSDTKRRDQLRPIVEALTYLGQEVTVRLLERGAGRIAKSTVRTINLPQTLPVLADILEVLPRIPAVVNSRK